MITTIDSSIQDFSILEFAARRGIYQEANESQNVDVVRQLNNLGMKPEVPIFSGPTIVSNYMDIATKWDILHNFCKNYVKLSDF